MAVITWDGTGERKFETGVDRGVLFPLNTETALYDTGFAWNGLTAVNEKPAGAGSNKSYADNQVYANLVSAETFGGTIEAFTYPDAFAACDGTATPTPGVSLGQQPRKTFGLCYRTKLGDDVGGTDSHYKLHLVYGALAAPSEKDYATVNDSPAPVGFSWDFDTTPVSVTDRSPVSLMTIDSSKVDVDALAALTAFLYGTADTDPSLPSPDSVIALFSGDITDITLTPATFNGTHTITIPTQTGVKYYVDNVLHAAGTITLTTGQSKLVEARPDPGFVFNEPVDKDWLFTFVS